GAPPPPEPCPALPLLACSVRQDEETQGIGADRHEDIRVGRWEQSWSEEEYAAAIDTVRAAIARGDVYQVNLVQHLEAPFTGDPTAFAAALAPLRPLHSHPFVASGWAVVSASPELFLARRGDLLITKPIKGTRPAGDHVAALEPVGRGASMGALGRIDANGDFDLALTIRTFAVAEQRVHLWVGGGIVWDSDPEAEIEEAWVKARPLLAAVGGLVHA